jgi:Flp pilus assembly protein TadG
MQVVRLVERDMSSIKRRRARRGEGGAAAVEFALLAPIVLLLVFGIIQYGLYFWADQGGSDAARDAARLAAVGKPIDCSDFQDDVQSSIDKMGNNFDITRTYNDTDGIAGITVGDTVTVTVEFDSIDLHIPFLPFIQDGRVSSTAKARVEFINDGTPENPCS